MKVPKISSIVGIVLIASSCREQCAYEPQRAEDEHCRHKSGTKRERRRKMPQRVEIGFSSFEGSAYVCRHSVGLPPLPVEHSGFRGKSMVV